MSKKMMTILRIVTIPLIALALIFPLFLVNAHAGIKAATSAAAQGALMNYNNLSDLASSSTALSNLGAIGSALTSGQIYVGNASNVATAQAFSGDCSVSNAGALTCTTINGIPPITGAGTGTTKSGVTLNSNAVYQVSFQPGLITSIVNTKSAYSKIGKTATVDNIEGSASSFSCVGNPTVTMYECGTSASCNSPTTIGTVTITAGGQAFDGTVSNSAITAGDYIAFAISAGTCTSLDVSIMAQVHSN